MRRVLAVALLVLMAGMASAQTSTKKSSRKTTPRTPAVAPTADERAEIAKRLQDVMDSWSAGDVEKMAPYFAKDSDLIFFDLVGVEYKGWDAYAAGLEKYFNAFDSVNFRLNGDATVHQKGDMAYATATWDALTTLHDQSKQHFIARWTIILEKRGQDWLVVHMHASAPLAAPAAGPKPSQQ
jgi:uncharacterized protein (TIGR02246 family)